MKVIPIGRLRTNRFRAAFGQQVQPTVQFTDYTSNFNIFGTTEMNNLAVNPTAGCIHLREIYVPHNQRIVNPSGFTYFDVDANLNSTLPTVWWDNLSFGSASGAMAAQTFGNRPHAYQEIDWNYTGASGGSSSDFTPLGHISAHTSFQDPNAPPPDDPDNPPPLGFQGVQLVFTKTTFWQYSGSTPPSMEVVFRVGGVTDYKIRLQGNRKPHITRNQYDGQGEKDLTNDFKGPESNFKSLGNLPPGKAESSLTFRIMVLNYRVMVSIGGETTPLSQLDQLQWTEQNPPLISDLTVTLDRFNQCSFAAHPIKYATEGHAQSGPIALGFAPQPSTDMQYLLTGSTGTSGYLESGDTWAPDFPIGSLITIERPSGINLTDVTQYYKVTLTQAPGDGPMPYQGDNYADFTPIVARVSLKVNGITDFDDDDILDLPSAKEVIESQTFDPVGLTIRHDLQVIVDNFHGQWFGTSGNTAVSLSLGYAQPTLPSAGESDDPNAPLAQRFVGFFHRYEYTRPNPAVSLVKMVAKDRMQILQDAIIAAPADMDGWNHYYAISYLAQAAGIPQDHFAFNDMVPDDPYSFVDADTEAYFLPFGFGMHPWTPRNRILTILELMNYVRQPTGFMLFFDQFGFLHYEKYRATSSLPVTAIFTEVPTNFFGQGEGDALTEIWDLQVVSDTDPVRNSTYLLGIDGYSDNWINPIPEIRRDDASIKGRGDGSLPDNFCGYEKKFVWTDSRFATVDFASTAADRLQAINRNPEYSATFQCWMQPTVHAGDVIAINESKTGIAGLPLVVLQVTNRYSILGGNLVTSCFIYARYVYEPDQGDAGQQTPGQP